MKISSPTLKLTISILFVEILLLIALKWLRIELREGSQSPTLVLENFAYIMGMVSSLISLYLLFYFKSFLNKLLNYSRVNLLIWVSMVALAYDLVYSVWQYFYPQEYTGEINIADAIPGITIMVSQIVMMIMILSHRFPVLNIHLKIYAVCFFIGLNQILIPFVHLLDSPDILTIQLIFYTLGLTQYLALIYLYYSALTFNMEEEHYGPSDILDSKDIL